MTAVQTKGPRLPSCAGGRLRASWRWSAEAWFSQATFLANPG